MREELTEAAERLEGRPAQEILRWAVERYSPRLAMATAFGAEGCAILHMLAEIGSDVFVFNLDTGYQFAETLETRERLIERYGIPIHFVRAESSVAEMEHEYGGPIYGRDPNLCCHIRKVAPLERTLKEYDAWISAIRRDQTPDRAGAPVVGWDAKFHLVKVNPLVDWTKKDVWTFLMKHDVPYNPLHDQGYPSIGCWPCTRPVMVGEDDRAGRWAGLAKTECGLHSREQLIQIPDNR
jgi:phosphoadenosine phosphosulfate reductase